MATYRLNWGCALPDFIVIKQSCQRGVITPQNKGRSKVASTLLAYTGGIPRPKASRLNCNPGNGWRFLTKAVDDPAPGGHVPPDFFDIWSPVSTPDSEPPGSAL
jgi:hypothetical protein